MFCFENRGVEIGVTLHHPHGQIYALPVRARRAPGACWPRPPARRRAPARNLFADVLAAERAAGDRVVAANEHWTAFVPAAARWPFEVQLVPAPPGARHPGADRRRSATRSAPLYLDVLRRLDGLFGSPMPYIVGLAPGARSAPTATWPTCTCSCSASGGPPDKLKYLAGSESAMGVFVNDIAPERARRLRAALGFPQRRTGPGAPPQAYASLREDPL